MDAQIVEGAHHLFVCRAFMTKEKCEVSVKYDDIGNESIVSPTHDREVATYGAGEAFANGKLPSDALQVLQKTDKEMTHSLSVLAVAGLINVFSLLAFQDSFWMKTVTLITVGLILRSFITAEKARGSFYQIAAFATDMLGSIAEDCVKHKKTIDSCNNKFVATIMSRPCVEMALDEKVFLRFEIDVKQLDFDSRLHARMDFDWNGLAVQTAANMLQPGCVMECEGFFVREQGSSATLPQLGFHFLVRSFRIVKKAPTETS